MRWESNAKQIDIGQYESDWGMRCVKPPYLDLVEKACVGHCDEWSGRKVAW